VIKASYFLQDKLKRDMNTENIYQIIDDLEAFADKVGSEWMKERLAMLEVHIINQSTK
jgi:hypothetical protein